MARGCSHCGHNGHNSRTCPDRGVRLFGVRLTDGVMRKSVSMGNLHHYASSNNPPSPPENSESGAGADGYVSDGLVHTSNNARERKKGQFLLWALHHHLYSSAIISILAKPVWYITHQRLLYSQYKGRDAMCLLADNTQCLQYTQLLLERTSNIMTSNLITSEIIDLCYSSVIISIITRAFGLLRINGCYTHSRKERKGRDAYSW